MIVYNFYGCKTRTKLGSCVKDKINLTNFDNDFCSTNMAYFNRGWLRIFKLQIYLPF